MDIGQCVREVAELQRGWTLVDIGQCVREVAELQRGWTLGSALGRTLSLERSGL